MNQEQAGQDLPIPNRLPQRLSEGMAVYDRDGLLVGTIKTVYLGGASDEAIQRALNPEKAPPTPAGEKVSTAFEADDIPQELRARLMKEGYIVVEGPDITGTHGYLGPEHVEGIISQEVEGALTDVVRLRVTRDELLNN